MLFCIGKLTGKFIVIVIKNTESPVTYGICFGEFSIVNSSINKTYCAVVSNKAPVIYPVKVSQKKIFILLIFSWFGFVNIIGFG